MGVQASRGTAPPTLDIVPLGAARPQHHRHSHNHNHTLHRHQTTRAKQPMPDPAELDKRFLKVLASMDLPPDKAKLLKSYDNEKKWEIICDQDMVQAKDSPAHYLNKLKTYLDPKASRSSRKRKMVGESTSTQVLRDLEISLRTNHIEWVREFLDENNKGLDVLIDYLSFRLSMMRHEQKIKECRAMANDGNSQANNTIDSGSSTGKHYNRPPLTMTNGGNTGNVDGSPTLVRRRSKHAAKLKMGTSTDDIHVCIMCMRAIMNNKYGFNMVIRHREAINCIALSLVHHSMRTKALVLELLAAICLVKGGHQIILSAFDNFKLVCEEEHRFHTLMEYFMNHENFHIEFMVACMQFVNIIVHSVENMNFRVHLQYEFTQLKLDEYLEKLRLFESEELQVQISAYLDNVFDVAALMEDSETKTAALEKVTELEDELSHANERIAVMEQDALSKIVTLESELGRLRGERDQLDEARRQVAEEVSTLRRAQQDSRNRQSMLENKIHELEAVSQTLPRDASDERLSSQINYGTNINDVPANHTSAPSPKSPTKPFQLISPPPPPPPPPVPSAIPGPPAPPVPPAPGAPGAPGWMCADVMTIKKKVHTKYKLPTLNWIALKPNQVRGTIFNELDEDKLNDRIDFLEFEEKFKIGINIGGISSNSNSEIDGLNSFPSKRFKKPDNITLLEHTRLRNIAISRRKLDIPVEKVIIAVNALDLKQLPLESVEILQRMIPTEQESKAYREYIAEKKNINLLTEEDKFLMQLTKVERMSAKLSIMSYMGNFFDNLHLITPQIHAIISAASSVKSSQKFRNILEVILAFGNYLNSSKRGPAYGFKLQSLDTLMDTKSTDKRISLLHYIVSTIRKNLPDLLSFESELLYIEKAAQVSLENVVSDVHEFEKGMEAVRKESEVRSNTKSPHNMVLRDFLNNTEEKLKRLRSEVKIAQDSFRECVEYFGETPRSCDANSFFSLLVRFTRVFKQADQENEQRRRLEQAALDASRSMNKENAVIKTNPKKQQDAVINELKCKNNLVAEKKLLQQDEVYNGALEDILLGLKSEPYRRADAVRRSHRRRINSHRLSKGLEELDV